MKTALIALAAAAAAQSTASAAYLAIFNVDDFATPNPPARDWAAGIAEVSNVTAHGTVGKLQPNSYQGWATTIDTNNYIGFTMTAEDGMQMHITSIEHGLQTARNAGLRVTSFLLGYRIDPEGDGTFGAWIFDRTYTVADTYFTSVDPDGKEWTVDITTTGTIEIGAFASSPNATNSLVYIQGQTPFIVNGTAAEAVPEPSSLVLGALGGLALLRRRRH
jgi:hypothetical protein